MARKPDFLLNLIREHLDLARIEGGELTIHLKASVDLVKDDAKPALVTCDPDLLKIVAVIFVGNAVKYGRDGGNVPVSVERAADRFAVAGWNEGPGFPPGQRGRLFRKFSRLDTVELRKRKGSGPSSDSTSRSPCGAECDDHHRRHERQQLVFAESGNGNGRPDRPGRLWSLILTGSTTGDSLKG